MEQTPGPWQVNKSEHYEHGKPCIIWGPNGPGRGAVCEMQAIFPREFNEADARLIAAAPDLLAACKAAIESYEVITNDRSPFSGNEIAMGVIKGAFFDIAKIRGAVAKAEGK